MIFSEKRGGERIAVRPLTSQVLLAIASDLRSYGALLRLPLVIFLVLIFEGTSNYILLRAKMTIFMVFSKYLESFISVRLLPNSQVTLEALLCWVILILTIVIWTQLDEGIHNLFSIRFYYC